MRRALPTRCLLVGNPVRSVGCSCNAGGQHVRAQPLRELLLGPGQERQLHPAAPGECALLITSANPFCFACLLDRFTSPDNPITPGHRGTGPSAVLRPLRVLRIPVYPACYCHAAHSPSIWYTDLPNLGI